MFRHVTKLLTLLLFLVVLISPCAAKSDNLLFDFDEIFGIKHETKGIEKLPEKQPKHLPSMKTDKLGFTLCDKCGSRVLDRERTDSLQEFGFPLCFRCMSEMRIESDGIEDRGEQEKIRQEYLNKYWRGCK